MLGTVFNIFRIQDLRNKILFTVALLIIYRVGFHISVPCFDQTKIDAMAETRDTKGGLARAAEYMQMFTGGTLQRSSLFGLGIMPYITSSIILMLLGEVVPALKKLRQEGQTGQRIDLCGYVSSSLGNGRCQHDSRYNFFDVAR